MHVVHYNKWEWQLVKVAKWYFSNAWEQCWPECKSRDGLWSVPPQNFCHQIQLDPQVVAFCGIKNTKKSISVAASHQTPLSLQLTELSRPHSRWGGGLAAPLPKNSTPRIGPSGLKLRPFWPCFSEPPHLWLSSAAPVLADPSLIPARDECKLPALNDMVLQLLTLQQTSMVCNHRQQPHLQCCHLANSTKHNVCGLIGTGSFKPWVKEWRSYG